MFYLYVDLCVLADVDIVACAINASTAIRLLYCYWQTVPSQWGGGRLFGASTGSPHENGRNSGTKSRRLDPLVSKFA